MSNRFGGRISLAGGGSSGGGGGPGQPVEGDAADVVFDMGTLTAAHDDLLAQLAGLDFGAASASDDDTLRAELTVPVGQASASDELSNVTAAVTFEEFTTAQSVELIMQLGGWSGGDLTVDDAVDGELVTLAPATASVKTGDWANPSLGEGLPDDLVASIEADPGDGAVEGTLFLSQFDSPLNVPGGWTRTKVRVFMVYAVDTTMALLSSASVDLGLYDQGSLMAGLFSSTRASTSPVGDDNVTNHQVLQTFSEDITGLVSGKTEQEIIDDISFRAIASFNSGLGGGDAHVWIDSVYLEFTHEGAVG